MADSQTIASLIQGLEDSRASIQTATNKLGLTNANVREKFSGLATAVGKIQKKTVDNADRTILAGNSYTLEPGYYDAVTFTASDGTENIKAQEKLVTQDSRTEQLIVNPDSEGGYNYLSRVVVEPIPSRFIDTSTTTVTADQVLSGAIFADKSGVSVGEMTNNGSVKASISVATPVYTIPAGYHSGEGTVTLATEEKNVDPSPTVDIEVVPTTGYALRKVIVSAIPKSYGDATNTDATSGEILKDKTVIGYDNVNKKAVKITGSMPNHGVYSTTFNPLDTGGTSQVILSEGYYKSATVSLTNDLYLALAAL